MNALRGPGEEWSQPQGNCNSGNKKLSKSNRRHKRKHYQCTETEGKAKSETEDKDEGAIRSIQLSYISSAKADLKLLQLSGKLCINK